MSVAEFKNEPFLDFSDPKINKKQVKAIEKVRSQFGGTYELVIGGKKIKTDQKFKSYNPSNNNEVIGTFYKASKKLADRAVKESAKKFEEWKNVSPKERASILFKAARIIQKRKYEFNAWLISEAGKNYAEADGETAETIDFLNFYGKEILRYSSKQPITKLKGEKNELFYIPIGSVTVIPPWNFPFAILAGMTSAAIVAGNTVVLKPSSDTPMMGKLFYDVMEEAGLPDGVLNFVPGSGGEVGDTLVGHPLTRAIAFTGSVDVGTHIHELAAKMNKGQIWVKRTVLEMGGKDAVIVDSEADVDEAVKGVVASAFGFQGQKCSAGSRAIIDKKIYNKFVKKLKSAVDEIQVGDAKNNFAMGPVACESAQNTIMNYIKIGKKEGKLLTGGNKIKGPGYYIEPTVFTDVKPNARIAQEEIFGPVLSVIKSENFDDALKIANGTIYGLTGSVYSKNKNKLLRAKDEFFVGNLYFNRKSTGALVGVHPFGGFNMSGTDSKAGGRDYLLLFMQAKLVSEKK